MKWVNIDRLQLEDVCHELVEVCNNVRHHLTITYLAVKKRQEQNSKRMSQENEARQIYRKTKIY